MKISTALCEFTGAIIGDGNLWTDGSRYRVEIAGDTRLDYSYFNYLSVIANSLFKKEPYRYRVRGNEIYFRLQSEYAFRILNKELGIFAGRGKSRIVKIPRLIMKKGWHYTKWVIRGIMDTDGTLFFSNKTYKSKIYPTIEIKTFSKNLALQINHVLIQQGFRARMRGNQEKGFCVALYGYEMLYKWLKEIGLSNNRHINKLNKIYTLQAAVAQSGRAPA